METWTNVYPATRRIQYSSCDACRQSRVACDASKFGHRPGEIAWSGSCSQCATRRRPCTFEWMKKQPRTQRRSSGTQPAPSPCNTRRFRSSNLPYYESLSNLANASETFPCDIDTTSTRSPSSDPELVDTLLVRCADAIFSHGFGPIFGRWVGRHGCPLVNEPTSDISIPPLKLFRHLDLYMDEQLLRHPSQARSTVSPGLARDEEIDRCLSSAMQAYAARWIPMFLQGELSGSMAQCDDISTSSWRAARRDMLKAINRPSYRTVLALYLFGQTPVPRGISQEEELDGLSGLVCSQTALLYVQRLRERLRSCQFNGSEVSAWSDAETSDKTSPSSNLTEDYLALESRAYWATVTWDTSDSMTLNFRSTLSSGLRGACWEPVWQLTRTFLVGSFREWSGEWRKKGVRVSDDASPRIISGASICTIYTWRTIASLKEALREGVEESIVQSAWTALLDAIEVFKTTIQPILSDLERQLHFLDQVDRLNWYVIVLLYNAGLLILFDALEAANRSDLLEALAQTSLEAENDCFNVLKFGIESIYKIVPNLMNPTSVGEGPFPSKTLTVSFVAIDPYPHHVVAAVRLMNKAFLRQYCEGTIKREAYLHLSSTLQKALDQLPQNSKAVQSARNNLRESLRAFDSVSGDDAGSELT